MNFLIGVLAASFLIFDANSDPITPKLAVVARADGKIFFADMTTRTWAASKTFCESSGMKFAEITTEAQYKALSQAYNATNFNGRFWTAGRDSYLISQFRWDGSKSELDASYSSFNNTLSSPYTCLQVFISSSAYSLYNAPCTNVYGTLCELLI